MIFTDLSPNTQMDDVLLSLRLLFSPRRWIHGSACRDLEDRLCHRVGVKYAFTFSSGRMALFALLKSLQLGKGDEVLLQAYTCVAVPDAILWAGLKPVYVDCQQDFTLSIEDLKKKLSSKSRVLIVQHTFGIPADMESILRVAREHHLFVLEDCAHALGGEYRGRKLGSLGDASFFSFGRDKMISSVFGGAVATSREDIAEKVKHFQGNIQIPSRWWVIQQLLHPIITTVAKKFYNIFSLGKILLWAAKRMNILSLAVEKQEREGGMPSHFGKLLPNALALLAIHQFEKLDIFIQHHQNTAQKYLHLLQGAPLVLPQNTAEKHSLFLRFTVLVHHAEEVCTEAKKRGIFLGRWYDAPVAPLGVNEAAVCYQRGSCPQAEYLSERSINLPTDIHITEKDVLEIVDFLRGVL